MNNTSYAAPNGGVGTMANVYLNGITANCEFNLSGLTAGNSYYLIIDGNGGLSSTFYIEMPSGGVDCNILLPVTWTAFNVECEMGNRRISWTVATQQDNDHFEVERSLDGSSWNVFATVPGEGNTQTVMSYEVLDNNSDILFEQPLIYYRVKQVDVNGNFSFTPVEASSCSVLVYPNPASDHIIVAVPFAGADVQLVDAIGRVVEVRKAQGTTIRMDIGDLASGYYAVQLLSSGEMLGSAVVVKL